MIKWEYKTVDMALYDQPRHNLQEILNTQGKEWELAHIWGDLFIFRKPLLPELSLEMIKLLSDSGY